MWGTTGKIGIRAGEFNYPTDVVISPEGVFYVADICNHRIQKFSPDGIFLSSFGIKGEANGRFDHAIAVAVAGDGTVFAVDFGNSRIEKWRPITPRASDMDRQE